MASSFIPALRLKALTPLYDRLVSHTPFDIRTKGDMLDHVRVDDARDFLDFGCGTGTLAMLLKQGEPSVRVTGIDVNPAVLSLARRKAASAGLDVRFDRYDGARLPYGDHTFDRVLSSYVFHHLDDTTKMAALQEFVRILRPGGELYLMDFDRAESPVLRAVFNAIRLLDGNGATRANARGILRSMVARAGFAAVNEVAR